MSFDITTESYSSLISIFSAIIGLSYPVLLQSIQRIDEQYDSVRLSRRFQQEFIFKIFKWILFINIIISLLSPFVIYVFGEYFSVAVISVQTLFVAAMLFSSFHLFNVIQIYYNPDELLKRLKNEMKPLVKQMELKSNYDKISIEMMNLIDISKYASSKGIYDIYNRSFSEVYNCFGEYQRTVRNNMDVQYPNGFMDVLLELSKYYINNIRYAYFYNDNRIIFLLYNNVYRQKISESTYQYIWKLLNDIIICDNKDWFNQYWRHSDQYYSSTFVSISTDNGISEKDDKDRFFEFHVVLGALLVYNRKYEWLKYIMYFTSQIPASYYLIPGTFVRIFELMKKFNKMQSHSYMLISLVYPFKGIDLGVESDESILNEIYKYLSLLFIRMFMFNDFNINFCDPKELPNIGEDISDNKFYISLVDILRENVNNWFNSKCIEKINFEVEIPTREVVLELLDQYQRKCESRIDAIVSNPKLDTEKIKQLKNGLLENELIFLKKVIDKNNVIINDSIRIENYAVSKLEFPYKIKLYEDDIIKGFSKLSYNLEENIIKNIFDYIYGYYAQYFTINKSLIDYAIIYANLFKAISALALNKDKFVIIVQGVSLENYENIYGKENNLVIENNISYYNQIPIVNIISSEPSVLIIRKDDLPFYNFIIKDNSPLSLIDSRSKLFSNLDNIDPKTRILELKYYVNFYYKKEVQYVRFLIKTDPSSSNDGEDLNNILTFDEIVKSLQSK